MAVDRRSPGNDGLGLTRFALGPNHLLAVRPAAIDKGERVFRLDRAVTLMERAIIGEEEDALARSQAEVESTLRADPSVLFQLFGADQFAAPGAFHPDVVWDLLVGPFIDRGDRSKLAATVEKSSHGRVLSDRRECPWGRPASRLGMRVGGFGSDAVLRASFHRATTAALPTMGSRTRYAQGRIRHGRRRFKETWVPVRSTSLGEPASRSYLP